jgi:hypothetical protein
LFGLIVMMLLHKMTIAALLALFWHEGEAFSNVAIRKCSTKHSKTCVMGQSSYSDTSGGVKAIVSSLTGLFNVGAPAAVVASSESTAAITPEALLQGIKGEL